MDQLVDSALDIEVEALDVLVLLLNVIKAAQHKEIGHEDLNHTLTSIYSRLRFKAWIERDILESALYCANRLNEEGEFWHPHDKQFKLFHMGIVNGKYKFDPYYNKIRPTTRRIVVDRRRREYKGLKDEK